MDIPIFFLCKDSLVMFLLYKPMMFNQQIFFTLLITQTNKESDMSNGEATFGFFIPTVSLMGIGSHREVCAQMKSLGVSKPFLVADKGITAAGLTKQICDMIKEGSGVDAGVYDETVPNPTDKNVAEGVELYKKSGCDMIITLGGGSSHDCGKGIGLVASNGGTIHDMEGVDQSTKAMPPFIAINTTAGTGSEMTRFCIITDTSRKVKMAIVDWRCTPNIAINDPLLMMGMPSSLTAATGMDALTHSVEAYVSTIATPITDACAIKAIELIAQNLRQAVANGTDIQARDKMAYAEYLAGMAFNNASLGHVHAMAHQLGGFYNLPHGVCNAILLPHVSRFNLIAKLERFGDIAVALGENIAGLSVRDAAERALTAIQTLSSDVGIPANLTELGVKKEDLKTMAENAQKDACAATNPRLLTLDDVIGVYTNAL
jgi:alcohol dehydrogenase